uniref:Thyrotropin releasing hormone degrading enzyme n=1 Tax=Ornithorhynchus anatinus TaxID=9258 RepID=A0A6I8PEG3_ORNAN
MAPDGERGQQEGDDDDDDDDDERRRKEDGRMEAPGRTPERPGPAARRLLLALALAVPALLLLTALSVLLGLRSEGCPARPVPSASRAPVPPTVPLPPTGPVAPTGPAAPPPWPRGRLPAHLKPLHYNLMLAVFMDNFTFSGEVNVEVACRSATRHIVLHASRVAVERVQVAEDRRAGAVPVAGHFVQPRSQVLVVALNRTLEPRRNYNLKIVYRAPIENELLGFFRSSYVFHGERRFLGVTQFSPTHARKALPCFDEPIYKATFKISIKHQATYLSLSNMPVETSVIEEDGWVTDHFSQTPLMSTYYLAWAVCNFTFRETTTKSGVIQVLVKCVLWTRSHTKYRSLMPWSRLQALATPLTHLSHNAPLPSAIVLVCVHRVFLVKIWKRFTAVFFQGVSPSVRPRLSPMSLLLQVKIAFHLLATGQARNGMDLPLFDSPSCS